MRASGQRLADAAVHALGGEALPLCRWQGLDGVVDRAVVVARGRLLDLGDQPVDRRACASSSRSPSAASAERVPSSMRSASTRDWRSVRARMSSSALAKALAQHARDVVVGQAVARLDGDRGLDARGLLARPDCEQPVGVDLEGHADARRAGDHRRDAAQLEARQRAAVGDQLALALHDVQREAVWPSLKVVKSCARAHGSRCCAG